MKKFGLIGYPLTNDFSKKFFEEKFLSLNLVDHFFENYSLENIDQLNTVIKNNPELCGLMVTVPYKQQVMKFLDETDEIAAKVGAVNCLKIDNGHSSMFIPPIAGVIGQSSAPQLIGYNTDIFGFENSLNPFINNYDGSALILGTGGAAKAIAYVLSKLKIDFTFVSRYPTTKNEIPYSSLSKKIMENHHLIINCTPVGMFPNLNDAPVIPYEFISSDHFVYDLIYHPQETLFLKKCKAQGAKTKNGLEMLHLQAEEGLRIFLS